MSDQIGGTATANVATKRLTELLIVLAAAIPVFLVCLICAPIIWLETRRNPLFVQLRVGKDQRHFKLLKLRTMSPDTGDHPSHEVNANKVTRIGRLLRASKIDELPQLWNVALGQMSFVGPRPCLPSQKELISEREKRGVYNVRPGITGPAQLAGIDMSQPIKLAEADAYYLIDQSFRNDLFYMVQTVLGKGSGDRVVL